MRWILIMKLSVSKREGPLVHGYRERERPLVELVVVKSISLTSGCVCVSIVYIYSRDKPR